MTIHSSINQPKPVFDSSSAEKLFETRLFLRGSKHRVQFNNGWGLSRDRRNNRRAFQLTRDDTRRNARPSLPGESASERGKKVARNPDSRRYFREGRRMPCSDLAPHRHTFLLQQFSIIFVIDTFFDKLWINMQLNMQLNYFLVFWCVQ